MKTIDIKYSTNTPKYHSEEAAGADIQAFIDKDIVIKPLERSIIPTGIYLEIPKGYEAQVRPRSGLAAKYGVTVLNTPGTIDSDYRGEIKVILINLGQNDFIVSNLDRIAQLVIAPVIKANFQKDIKLNQTTRGEGGFGSTGL
ncbi:dUTP diphosphatase [Thiospirochaeta perfilievii]|uniref:Deoxyuridine 5'-triphosphate nucleotidohydrolase n=1 Tax=Thiospirochaeta perfilievii TaxID=252967 RepID=A0A5C1QFP2_9SPIO|nr:dUTP diphosphatase [Thiospirochaeta perfilievii]QEN06237.1 dUTP diphosphatase [Thiospirochaeta perfilievii]